MHSSANPYGKALFNKMDQTTCVGARVESLFDAEISTRATQYEMPCVEPRFVDLIDYYS